MEGGFAMGANDPEVGRRQAEKAGAELTMRATIRIEDLDAFLADPRHPGRITGTVSHPDLGQDLPASTGVFRLFSPTAGPKAKQMVYEFGFRAGGRPLYLAGRKEVRDDSGFDMLKDTTTLFTTLHLGSDARGPVIGAGILRLGLGDFGKLLTTIRATEARSPAEGAAAILRFGRFFAGELWDSYH
jgi:hypothetical protein